jgi:hypothetical protein
MAEPRPFRAGKPECHFVWIAQLQESILDYVFPVLPPAALELAVDHFLDHRPHFREQLFPFPVGPGIEPAARSIRVKKGPHSILAIEIAALTIARCRPCLLH